MCPECSRADFGVLLSQECPAHPLGNAECAQPVSGVVCEVHLCPATDLLLVPRSGVL